MASSLQKTLTRAVALVLRPLLRLWLKNGMSHRAFEEVMRWVMVDLAFREFKLEGKKQTDSRVAVITGLTRHQVSAYRKVDLEDSPSLAKANRATKVMTGWLSDSDFLDEQGKPLALSFQDREPSFIKLVSRYGGDVTPKAVADELLQMGEVSKEGEWITPVSTGHVPIGDLEALIEIAGHDAASLLDTLEHNLQAEKGTTRFQKKVSYGGIDPKLAAAFQQASSEEAQKLLEKWNEDLKEIQKDSRKATTKRRYGWGLYFFEKKEKKG